MENFNESIEVEGKIIGIIGTRRRNSDEDLEKVIETFLKIYKLGDIICSGGCDEGGDKFANIIAKQWGLSILTHYPDWMAHHQRAGFIRNTKIAKDSTVLIACVASDRKGGTEDTIEKFEKLHPYGKIILV